MTKSQITTHCYNVIFNYTLNNTKQTKYQCEVFLYDFEMYGDTEFVAKYI